MFELSWFVTAASIVGGMANSNKKRWGFAIWMFTNAFWFTYDMRYGLYSQALLYVIYFALAVIGFVRWGKPKAKQTKQQGNNSLGEMALPGGISLTAENYGDDPVWKSIDIVIHYPDGTSETVCCADYEEQKNLLRVLAFNQGNTDEPAFSLDYLSTEGSTVA